jgi:hypothetical protein
MSKSYINELRGSVEHNPIPQIDVNNNANATLPSIQSIDNLKSKASSISLPQARFHDKLTVNFQSAITLLDHSKLNSTNKSIINDIDMTDHQEKTPTANKSILKDTTNRLTVPATGDYCLRISNASSICDEEKEQRITFNDSRVSDVLGYLHMYQNNNRLQFNGLRFNDREDLQVKTRRF